MTPFADELTTWLLMCASKFFSEIKQSTLQARIQLDESTDSALESHLIAFDRHEKDKKTKEEFLFSNTLSATTTAADVKTLVDFF